MTPLDTENTYYAIVDFTYDKTRLVNGSFERKHVKTTVPEEIGSRYQDLCSFNNAHGSHGGFCLTPTGELIFYTKQQLVTDYDPDYDSRI